MIKFIFELFIIKIDLKGGGSFWFFGEFSRKLHRNIYRGPLNMHNFLDNFTINKKKFANKMFKNAMEVYNKTLTINKLIKYVNLTLLSLRIMQIYYIVF